MSLVGRKYYDIGAFNHFALEGGGLLSEQEAR